MERSWVLTYLNFSMNDNEFLKILGNKIKKLRLRKAMTQTALAACCEFEKANMSRIEAGKINVTILSLKKISTALDVEMATLFRDHSLQK